MWFMKRCVHSGQSSELGEIRLNLFTCSIGSFLLDISGFNKYFSLRRLRSPENFFQQFRGFLSHALFGIFYSEHYGDMNNGYADRVRYVLHIYRSQSTSTDRFGSTVSFYGISHRWSLYQWTNFRRMLQDTYVKVLKHVFYMRQNTSPYKSVYL